MKQVLDDLPNKNELNQIHRQIKKLEEKSWYGMALLIIVSALILISTLIHGVMGFEESTPIIILNGLLVIVHMVLVYLSKSDKLLAYSGGLLVFIVALILNFLFTGRLLVGGKLVTMAIISCYVIFIYESNKVKKLRQKLES